MKEKKQERMPDFGPIDDERSYMVTLFFWWLDRLVKKNIITRAQASAARAEYLRECDKHRKKR